MSAFKYRFRGGAAQKDQLLNGWVSWMPSAPASDRQATRFTLPGILDPNHMDGIGPLWLLAHLPMSAPGSPGALNLTGGKVRLRARLSDDFQANGYRLALWLCRNLPSNQSSSINVGQQTNWAHTGYDFLSELTAGEYSTAECVVSSDPAGWTYAGVNSSWQGEILANRYTEKPVAETIADVSATLHLCFIGPGRVDLPPSGTVDIDWVEVESNYSTTPPVSYTTASDWISTNPLGALRAMGALARNGDINAQFLYGKWLANGVVGSTLIEQDTVTAAEMLAPLASTHAGAAFEYARLLTAGDGVDRDAVAARSLLAGHTNDPACRAVLASMKQFGIGGVLDLAAAFADYLWAAGYSKAGVPQPGAMASVGRMYLTAQGTAYSVAQAYIWLKRAQKFGTGYISAPALTVLAENITKATAELPYPGAAAELDAGHVTNWTPTAI